MIVVVCLFASLTNAFFTPEWVLEMVEKDDVNGGGVDCAACTIAVSLLEQLSVIHNQPIERVLDLVCDWLPVGAKQTCLYFVATYGADITKFVEQDLNADEVCAALKICTDPTCGMYKSARTSSFASASAASASASSSARANKNTKRAFDPWAWLKALFLAVASHKPDFDVDGDNFVADPTLRGYNWRGADCDLFDANVYPGRSDGDETTDFNCNGISGVNATSGKSFESELCDDVPHYGVIVIGDSAGAHFSIPADYMNASAINAHTYDDLLYVLSDEFDHPHRGGYTGFMNSVPGGKVDSLYKRMRAHNHCIHRDYQNCACNGVRSSSVGSMIDTVARNNKTDHPALVIIELIGNDVCNGHRDTFAHMTSVVEFEKNMLAALRQLDAKLPAGSHVVLVGLADGLVLYDSMHARTHPIGVTYETVYDFLNCLDISPCRGWMNSNATIRNMTQAHANLLNTVYPKIIAQNNFTNFDVIYYDFPFKQILALWKKLGGRGAWQLIEPIDGFHPNQNANWLAAQFFWQSFAVQHPGFIGPENPNNALIEQLFGDQGGYA